MSKLELLRNLTAHRNSNPTTAELIELSVDMALKELNPNRSNSEGTDSSSKSVAGSVKVSDPSMKHKFTSAPNKRCVKNNIPGEVTEECKKVSKWCRHIPTALRLSIWQRDYGCCQYTDKKTNKKCESKFALQIDHIHPFSLGGSNEKENLRLLCRNHNNWRTRELYSQRFVKVT